MPNATHVNREILGVQAGQDPVKALSLARAAYRVGLFAEAARVCNLYPGPEADLLLGLIAWEKGKDHDFATAGWEADWLRAVRHRRLGDTKSAIAAIDRYIAQVPKAWYHA